jgi:tetratricopeptide (TPR) repeat protein
MLRIIREEEPQKPSTRLSTTDELPSISANRGLEPNKLSALVRGELDWIVMKALEKDRNRRYETANGFALDIQRYLADEPVQACPPSAAYRLRKLVRRNKAALTAGTLVVAALVIGTVVSAWQAVQATNARNAERASREAERKAQTALDVAREEKDQQRTRTNRELSDALVEAAGLWEKARIAGSDSTDSGNQLRATLGRAATLAASELADPILVARVRTLQENLAQDEKERRMLARLEEIQFDKTEKPNDFNWRNAYEAAFNDYGLPISEFLSGAAREEKVEETARRIAASPIRDRLVAALDDCAANMSIWCQQLLPIARRVDEKNPWRRQYYDARMRNDVPALLRLASQPEALTQPPSFILNVAGILGATVHDALSATRLLREAQLLYPSDFLIMQRLADAINPRRSVVKPTAPHAYDEIIGLYRAALAARPENHGVHRTLAYYLRQAGQEGEAVAVYRHLTGLKSATASEFIDLGCSLWFWRKKDRDLNGAIAAFQKALEVDPKSREAYVALAFALRTKGDSEGAADAEQKVLEGDQKGQPDSAAWAYHSFGQKIREWDLEESAAAFRKAIELDPNCAEYTLGLLGSVLEQKGDLEGAADARRKEIELKHKEVELLRKEIELKPNDLLLRRKLFEVLSRQNDWEAAVAALRNAIEHNPKIYWLHKELANILWRKYDFDGAIASFREAVKLYRLDTECRESLALLLLQKGDVEGAITVYRELCGIRPDLAVYTCRLASALRQKGNLDESIAVLRKAIESNPKWDEAHCELGRTLHAKGDVDGALAEYREAWAIRPDVADYPAAIGAILRREKRDLEGAIDAFRKAKELSPRLTEPRSQLAEIFLERGDLDGAIAEYRGLCEVAAKEGLFPWRLGHALLRKGDLDGAIAAFRQATENSPQLDLPHTDLVSALLARGDSDGAIAACRRAIELDPKWNIARSLLPQTLSAKGDYEGAIAAYQQAVEMVSALTSTGIHRPTGLAFFTFPNNAKVTYVAPAHHTVLNDFAWLLATCPEPKYRDPSRAVELAKKATEQAPNIGGLWNTLGAAQYRAGDWQAAVAAFNKSMELRNGGDAHDWFFLAMVHWRLGERDKARQRYEQAVQWIEKNNQALTTQPTHGEELRRFRSEAEEVLELKK